MNHRPDANRPADPNRDRKRAALVGIGLPLEEVAAAIEQNRQKTPRSPVEAGAAVGGCQRPRRSFRLCDVFPALFLLLGALCLFAAPAEGAIWAMLGVQCWIGGAIISAVNTARSEPRP